ncbi:MAG: FecR domain-containing protein [Bacteroidota bacterium]
MQEDVGHNAPHALIAQYLAGELSLQDRLKVEAWLAESADNQAYFDELQIAWTQMDLVESEDILAVEPAWDAFKARVQTEAKVKPLHEAQQQSAESTKGFPWMRIAAAGLVLILSAVLLWQFVGGSAEKPQLVRNDTNGNMELKLEDGSVITLRQGAELAFPTEFAMDERRVVLSGEAFFEVESDPAHPFIVEAGEIEVKVLGTAFSVKNDLNTKEAEVQVQEGTVQVEALSPSKVVKPKAILRRGQQASYAPKVDSVVVERKVDVNAFAWKTRELNFEQMTLIEAIEVLEELYEVPIGIESDFIKDCLVTSTNHKDEPLETILKKLASIEGNQLETTGNGYIIKGENCAGK